MKQKAYNKLDPKLLSILFLAEAASTKFYETELCLIERQEEPQRTRPLYPEVVSLKERSLFLKFYGEGAYTWTHLHGCCLRQSGTKSTDEEQVKESLHAQG